MTSGASSPCRSATPVNEETYPDKRSKRLSKRLSKEQVDSEFARVIGCNDPSLFNTDTAPRADKHKKEYIFAECILEQEAREAKKESEKQWYSECDASDYYEHASSASTDKKSPWYWRFPLKSARYYRGQ